MPRLGYSSATAMGLSCSAGSTWTWHSYRSCFLIATMDGNDDRENVLHHMRQVSGSITKRTAAVR